MAPPPQSAGWWTEGNAATSIHYPKFIYGEASPTGGLGRLWV